MGIENIGFNMAQRQQIGKVAGYGNTSTPASRGVDTFSGAPAIATESSASALAKSFGLLTQSLSKTAKEDAREAKAEKDLMDKNRLQSLASTWQKENKNKVLSRVQAGELYPELSKTNQMFLAQIIANNQTNAEMDKFADDLNTGTLINPATNEPYGDDVWKNKNLLEGIIENKRSELLDKYSIKDSDDNFMTNADGSRKTNEFAYEGSMRAFKSKMNQYNTQWTAQRGKYHREEATTYYKNEVSSNLNEVIVATGTDGKTDYKSAWEKIGQADYLGKKMSPLGNKTRKDIIFKQTLETALNTRNSKLLDSIPNMYKDGNSQDLINATKNRINNALSSENAAKIRETNFNRSNLVRKEKMSVIEHVANGGKVDKNYLEGLAKAQSGDTSSYLLALQLRNQPILEETQSKANMSKLMNDILIASTSNDKTKIKGFTGNLDTDGLIDFIASSKDLNGAEKQALFAQIPKLRQGASVMRNPIISDSYDDTFELALKSIDGNKDSQDVLLNPTDTSGALKPSILYRADMKRIYNTHIQNAIKTAISSDKDIPQGGALDTVIQEALNKAQAYYNQVTKYINDVNNSRPAVIPQPPIALQ